MWFGSRLDGAKIAVGLDSRKGLFEPKYSKTKNLPEAEQKELTVFSQGKILT